MQLRCHLAAWHGALRFRAIYAGRTGLPHGGTPHEARNSRKRNRLAASGNGASCSGGLRGGPSGRPAKPAELPVFPPPPEAARITGSARCAAAPTSSPTTRTRPAPHGDRRGPHRRGTGQALWRGRAQRQGLRGRHGRPQRRRVRPERQEAIAHRRGRPRAPCACPSAWTSTSAGNLYVVDGTLKRIHVYDANGKFLRMMGQDMVEPARSAWRSTGAQAAVRGRRRRRRTADHKVVALDIETGKLLFEIGKRGEGPASSTCRATPWWARTDCSTWWTAAISASRCSTAMASTSRPSAPSAAGAASSRGPRRSPPTRRATVRRGHRLRQLPDLQPRRPRCCSTSARAAQRRAGQVHAALGHRGGQRRARLHGRPVLPQGGSVPARRSCRPPRLRPAAAASAGWPHRPPPPGSAAAAPLPRPPRRPTPAPRCTARMASTRCGACFRGMHYSPFPESRRAPPALRMSRIWTRAFQSKKRDLQAGTQDAMNTFDGCGRCPRLVLKLEGDTSWAGRSGSIGRPLVEGVSYHAGARDSAVAGVATSLPAQAQIKDTKAQPGHLGTGVNKFSGTAEICVFCHTPHGADTSAAVPLWNRTLPAPDVHDVRQPGHVQLDGKTAPVGSVSIACLSCHDGVTSMSAVINAPGSGTTGDAAWTAGTGRRQPDGWSAGRRRQITNLGKDLKNDHPIGIQYGGGGFTLAAHGCQPEGRRLQDARRTRHQRHQGVVGGHGHADLDAPEDRHAAVHPRGRRRYGQTSRALRRVRKLP